MEYITNSITTLSETVTAATNTVIAIDEAIESGQCLS
jgi:hypothetical protein